MLAIGRDRDAPGSRPPQYPRGKQAGRSRVGRRGPEIRQISRPGRPATPNVLSRGIFADGSDAVRATGKVEVQLRDEPWGPVDPSVELKPGDRIHTG